MTDQPRVYDSDSYASPYAPDGCVFTDDARIFHRREYAYQSVRSVKGARLEGARFTADVLLDGDVAATLSIEGLLGDVLRIRLERGPLSARPASTEMIPQVPVASGDLRATEKDTHYELAFAGHLIRIGKEPFSLTVSAHGRRVLELETERLAGLYVTPPLGFRVRGASHEPFVSWRIANDERFFGLGEKWNKVEKSSTRATIWSADTCGSNTTDLSYKSLPLLFSTRGIGLLLHTSYRSFWEIGTFSYTSATVLCEDPSLDLFLLLGPTLRDLLGRYTALTGRPSVPPRWALGIWMSRCAYATEGDAEAAMRGLRERHIPCDVIHLDPLWMKTHYYFRIGVDACDFVPNPSGFPDLSGLFRRALANGFNTCLWINPYLPEGTAIYEEAQRRGHLLKSSRGGVARLEHGEPVGIVDFTSPAATEWYKEHLRALLRDGASVFKPDYGDRVPEDALAHDGRTGRELHNLYLFLYSKAAYDASREVRGEGFVWRRAGYVGSQRYPGTWAGDTQTTWEGLKHCLRGGLSAGLSGEAFWACDIGGFVGEQPSQELYIRWAELGMFCSLTRFHGTSPREPWHYGDRAVDVVRHYATMRYELVPYLLALAEEAAQTGLPLMRHMALEFPDDPGVDTLDDQYLLGPDLLVAPVLIEGARRRSVYLPRGRWFEFEEPSRVHEGGRFIEADAPLERIPLFVREGAVIPRYPAAPQHLKVGAAESLLLDVYAGPSQRRLAFDECGNRVEIEYHPPRLVVGPVPLRLTVRRHGFGTTPPQVLDTTSGITVDLD